MTRCLKCQGTKLIPFKGRKDAWVDCPDCHVEPPERYHHYQASDFDFPISYDFQRFYSERYGQADPGGLVPSIRPAPAAAIPTPPTKNEMLELRCLILDVQAKVDKRTKPKSKPTSTGIEL